MQPKIVRSTDALRLNVLGVEHILRVRGSDSGGLVLLIELNVGPGQALPAHVHTREDEIFHVLAGRVAFTIAGQATLATAGTTVYAPRNVPHGVRVGEDGPAHMLLTICPAGLEDMFVELGRLPPGPPDMDDVSAICARYGVSFVSSA